MVSLVPGWGCAIQRMNPLNLHSIESPHTGKVGRARQRAVITGRYAAAGLYPRRYFRLCCDAVGRTRVGFAVPGKGLQM